MPPYLSKWRLFVSKWRLFVSKWRLFRVQMAAFLVHMAGFFPSSVWLVGGWFSQKNSKKTGGF
jgi:uncharacterized membrane protein YedE/YeeE